MSTGPLADADGVEAGLVGRPGPGDGAEQLFVRVARPAGRRVGPVQQQLGGEELHRFTCRERKGTCGNSRREARWNRAGDSAGAGRGGPAWPVSEASATERAAGAQQVHGRTADQVDGDVLHARRAVRSHGDALLGRVLRFANASAPARSSPGAPRRSGRLPASEPGLGADTQDLAGAHRAASVFTSNPILLIDIAAGPDRAVRPDGIRRKGAHRGQDPAGLAAARRPAPHRQRPVSGSATPAQPPPRPGDAVRMPAPARLTPRPPTLAVVGAGPTAIGVLERLVANAPVLSGGRRLLVHLVDPHPPGGGRVWRAEQPSLLWANSLAADVTVLPDSSVQVEGPVGEGTTLWQWVERVGRACPEEDPVGREARRLSPTAFPSRPLVNAYLGWVLERVVDATAPWADVELHATSAVDVRPGNGGAEVFLADGAVPAADAVLLAQGHLDAHPTPAERAVSRRAADAGLTYLPTGYTADLDLSRLEPGQDVLVRGAGLAFVDLTVLLTSGRDGSFEREDDGRLTYRPSGAEPRLHVGSRRGVPSRAKLGYVWPGPPVPPRFFTPAAVAAQFGDRQLDLRADLAPLIARELGWAHYTELFRAHPGRTAMAWEEFAERYAASPDASALVAAAVPSPADRLDLAALDRPLAGRHFPDVGALQGWLRAHVRADLARAADPAFSSDAAVFSSLLLCHGTVATLVGAGRLTARSEAAGLGRWWVALFSSLASAPPSPRLEELLALSEAGIVRFLGADVRLELDDDARVFRARSTSHDEVVEARALVEARLPLPDVTGTPDPLVTRMLLRGSGAEKVLPDPAEAGGRGTGRLHVDAEHRVVDATGRPQSRVFAAGFWTSGGQVAAFARPRTNSPFFRQNDALARALWRQLTAVPAQVGEVA